MLAIGHDLTALEEAQQRALQAERLAAIGEMVAGLSHESRNALHRSQVCLEMLTFEVEDRPEALQLIARLQAAQDDLYRVFEDVRTYAAPIALRRVHLRPGGGLARRPGRNWRPRGRAGRTSCTRTSAASTRVAPPTRSGWGRSSATSSTTP